MIVEKNVIEEDFVFPSEKNDKKTSGFFLEGQRILRNEWLEEVDDAAKDSGEQRCARHDDDHNDDVHEHIVNEEGQSIFPVSIGIVLCSLISTEAFSLPNRKTILIETSQRDH